MKLLKQNQTAHPLQFQLVQTGDHATGATGLTPAVTISKNGGAFATPAGAVTEITNGWYQVAGNAADAGTLGPLLLHATATGADPDDREFQVVAFDPDAAFLTDKTGYSLAAGGLDAVAAAAPASRSAAATFPQLLMYAVRRILNKVTRDKSTGSEVLFGDDDATPIGTATATDNDSSSATSGTQTRSRYV
jgi:hypothetical protein